MAAAGMLALMSAGMGVAQGIAAMGSKGAEATMLEADAITLQAEAERQAALIEDEGKRFAARQKMMYIGSGVQIGGSAVVTLAQTDKWARTEAEAVRMRGRAIREYYGRAARIARREGVAAFISGVAGGVAQGIGTYVTARAGFGGQDLTKKAASNAYTKRQIARARSVSAMAMKRGSI